MTCARHTQTVALLGAVSSLQQLHILQATCRDSASPVRPACLMPFLPPRTPLSRSLINEYSRDANEPRRIRPARGSSPPTIAIVFER